MSFDIWVEVYRGGKIGAIDDAIFDEIFLPFCTNLAEYRDKNKFMQVEYPDGGRSDIYVSRDSDERVALIESTPFDRLSEVLKDLPDEKGAPIRHLAFSHCGGEAFYAGLYELIKRSRTLLHWDSPRRVCACASADVPKEIPKDSLFEDFRVVIVHSGQEIVDAINDSFPPLPPDWLDRLKRLSSAPPRKS